MIAENKNKSLSLNSLIKLKNKEKVIFVDKKNKDDKNNEKP